MLVAFCDQLTGNSTPFCSKAGFSGSPISASRISHSMQSKGCLPASVKRLGMLTPAPLAVTLGAVALRLWDMTSPLTRTDFAGTADVALRAGWNRSVDGELVLAGERVVLEAGDDGLELVEVGEVAVDRGELDRAHRVHPREAALGEVADARRLGLGSAAPRLLGDPRRDRLELVVADRPAAGRPGEPAQQLLAVEALAAPVSLDDVEARLLDALVGREALTALAALAPPAHAVGAGAGVDHLGRIGRAEGAKHTGDSTTCSASFLPPPQHVVPN